MPETFEFSKEVESILVVAQRGSCSEQEIRNFLPHYPIIHGSEPLIRIGGVSISTLRKYCRLEQLIKGLHPVKLKFRQMAEYGFGSPSPAGHLLNKLKKSNPELFQSLEKWIRENGGNYYYPAKEKGKSDEVPKQSGLFEGDE